MRGAILVAVVFLLAACPPPAHADFGDSGTLGIFFAEAPSSVYDKLIFGVVAFLPFDMWVLTYNVIGGMEAYEFSLQLPAGSLVSGGRILPEGATDFGTGADNFIVGTGGICRGATGWFTAVKYAGVLFLSAVGNDIPICLAGAQPSSFPNSRPGYLVCSSPGDLRNFGAAYIGCAVINCQDIYACVVPTDEKSFGALKAGYP